MYTIFVENRSADRFQLSREADVENKLHIYARFDIISLLLSSLSYLILSTRIWKLTIKFVSIVGDSKDATREKAQLVLLKIMEKGCMSPQNLLDRLRPAFIHKNAKLREEALILLTTTLNE